MANIYHSALLLSGFLVSMNISGVCILYKLHVLAMNKVKWWIEYLTFISHDCLVDKWLPRALITCLSLSNS